MEMKCRRLTAHTPFVWWSLGSTTLCVAVTITRRESTFCVISTLVEYVTIPPVSELFTDSDVDFLVDFGLFI